MDMDGVSARSLNVDVAKFLTPPAKRVDILGKVSSQAFMHMIESGLFADITLVARGGTVGAHRAYLASVSPVFHAMMNHETMKESLTSTIDVLHMPLEALQLFLLLLYIVPDDMVVMPQFKAAVDKHFEELCGLCRMYQVTRLIPTLNNALMRNLTPENCWDLAEVCLAMRRFSEVITEPRGRYVSMFYTWGDYIADNIEEVMKGSRVVEVVRQNPEIVLGLDKVVTELLKYDLPQNQRGKTISWRIVRSFEDMKMLVDGFPPGQGQARQARPPRPPRFGNQRY